MVKTTKVYRPNGKTRLKCGKCNSTDIKALLFEGELKYGIECRKCGYSNRRRTRFFTVKY